MNQDGWTLAPAAHPQPEGRGPSGAWSCGLGALSPHIGLHPPLPYVRPATRGGVRSGGMHDKQAAERGDDKTDFHTAARAEISREMVRLYKDQFGRGPTKARTEFAGPDIVICSLEESFTPAERRLVEMGEDQRLRDTRLFFQHATERQFCDVI